MGCQRSLAMWLGTSSATMCLNSTASTILRRSAHPFLGKAASLSQGNSAARSLVNSARLHSPPMASRRTKTKLYDASDPLNIYSDPLHKLNSTKTEQGEDEDSNSTSRPWSANCASMQRQHISDYLLPIYYATVINVIHKAEK